LANQFSPNQLLELTPLSSASLAIVSFQQMPCFLDFNWLKMPEYKVFEYPTMNTFDVKVTAPSYLIPAAVN
jgi:hypothetical protein